MLRCTDKDGAAAGPGSSIQDGNQVIVYLYQDEMKAVTVDSQTNFNCRFGLFKMQNWVGRPFGSKVEAQGGKGFVYLLCPTPELWTQVLRHRTQILYTADISLITSFLELKPGSAVLESGTGSGSLTHALARAVSPEGSVHTFEFHAERSQEAKAEFQRHRLSDFVHLQQRDIEALGFPEELHGQADAVFLDLPGPWKVIESAAQCLRSDGVFCAFSPCIEQVHKTCAALSRSAFYNVRTMECLLRLYEVRSTSYTTDVLGPSLETGAKRKRGPNQQEKSLEEESTRKTGAPIERVTAKPMHEARGHTGYLTFARRIVREDADLKAIQPDVTEQNLPVQSETPQT